MLEHCAQGLFTGTHDTLRGMTATTHYDCIVLGGGAAGLMAAGRAAERGKRVLLLEKNARVGKKLSMTGGGRCNILNAEKDVRVLLSHYGDAEQFLYTPFSIFGVDHTWDFFEKERGLPLKVEERNRAFPQSERAHDVVRVLYEWCVRHGVVVRTGCVALPHIVHGRGITHVSCGDTSYTATTYIFATGGLSHPETGATGDGFGWLRECGHTVHTPTPSVVPLAVDDAWVHALAGTTLRHSKITFFVDGVKKYTQRGDILCTHVGLSGPTILNTSQRVASLLREGEVSARIDIFPEMDEGALDAHIVAILDAHKNKDIDNALSELLPAALIRSVLAETPHTTVAGTTLKAHSFPRESRKKMVRQLKQLTCTITGLLGFEKAVIADGGVPLTEIDTRTFVSRVVPNLFIVGDLLHINRPSGGYSLQLCWTSGYLAGSAV